MIILLYALNPFISIAQFCQSKNKDHLKANKDKVFVISPIVDGDSIKGPTAKIFRELGHEPSVNQLLNFIKTMQLIFLLIIKIVNI